jgi:hypothetical protein
MPLVKLSGKQMGAAIEALAFAFPSYSKLERMLYTEADEMLSDYTNPKAMPEVLQDLLFAAQANGWLEKLFLGAFNANPGNPKLRELGPVLLLTGSGAPSVRLQGLVLGGNALVDVEEWRAGIDRAQKSVARFQIENKKDNNNIKGIATGFLVADDVLLTNCHVVDMLLQKAATAPAAEFDFVVGGEASEVIPLVGDWLIGSSPVKELDYALIRLPKGTGRPVMPTPKPYEFSDGDVYFIVQHPEGEPMKIGGGTMIGLNSAQQRVNYTTNTKPGSSGSPVFTTGWQPVALHCAGSMDETYNMGVPLAVVYHDAVKRGIWPAATP